MRILNQIECNVASGACGDVSCKVAALKMLAICSPTQRYIINMTLKAIALSDEMKNADPEVIKAAMIMAIQNMDIDELR